MAKKWSKKEIEEYIGTKQISQENYVAPVVETNYVPREQRTIQSVANTVDTFNNVNNNLKQAQTTIEPITTEKKKQENNSFSFSIDDAKKKNEIPGVVQRVKEIDPDNKMVSKYEKQNYIDYYNSLSKKQKAKENEKVAKELSNKHNKKYQESLTKANKESTPILTESLNNQLERQKQLTFNPTMEDRFNLNENYNVSSEKNPYSRNYDKTVRENAVSKETKEELDKNRNDVILADYLKNYYEQENQDPSLLEKIVSPLTQVGTLVTGPAKLLGYQKYKRADGLETYLPDKLDLNYQKTGEKIDNKIGKFAYDVGGEATKILSSELLNAVAPGVGSGLYWTSMYGNSYSGAKNNLTNQGKESNGSALLNAGIKTAFEYITGKALGSATKKLTGGTTSELEKALSNKAFNSKILQKLPENMRIKAANIFGSTLSEGTEEGIQEYLENLTDIITLGSDGKHDKVIDMLLDPDVFGDAMYSALVGGATGGTLSAVNGAGKETINKTEQLNIFKNAIQEDLNNTTDATKKEKLQDILNNIDNSLKKPFSIENENIENIAQTMDENKIGQLSQNKPLEQVIREDLAQEEQQTQEQPIQTPLNALNQGVLQENNQTPIQEQTPQITPLNQVNQELQETRQNDIADSVKAMNLEKQPEFKQKEGNYVYEKSNNSKIDTFRKDAATYLKAGEQTDNFVKTLEKIIEDKGIEIRFDPNLRDSQGRMANGSYSNNVITLNPNSNRAGEFLAIHELTHAIGTKSMINMIQKYRKSNAEFDSAVKRLLTTYNATEINEEALGDIAGQLFGNQEYINNLSMENPSLFKRIYNEIKYLWHQFRGYKNQNQFIEDLRNKWESAYRNQKIQQKAKNSNIEMSTQTDSNGNMLSNEQVDYFKNSKVRDEKGNLLEVYHGTPNSDFNEFKKGGGEHGKGFYFTEDKSYAEEFSDNDDGRLIKSYLKIDNPLSKDVDKNSSSMKKFVNEVSSKWDIPKEEILDIFNSYNEEWSSDLSSKVAEKMGYGIEDVENIVGFEVEDPEEFGITDYNAYLGSYAWDNGLNELARECGFDGIISRIYNSDADGYEYVAFNSNQIKNVDNLAPTTSDDIRYSKNEENKIQGLESYTRDEIKGITTDYIKEKLEENGYYANDIDIKGIDIHGSRNRGTAKANSDLDVVIQYDGDIREDDLFNILNDNGDDNLYINGIEVDINPIQEDINDYMKRSNEYDKEVLSKLENNQNIKYNEFGDNNDRGRNNRIFELSSNENKRVEKKENGKTKSNTKEEIKRRFDSYVEESKTKTIEPTKEQQKTIDYAKNTHGKNVIISNNISDEFGGGVNPYNHNEIILNVDDVEDYGIDFMYNHELMESIIMDNKELFNDYLGDLRKDMVKDSGWEKTRNNFTDENYSDDAIAKEIICDRFASLVSGKDAGYKLELSQMLQDYLDKNLNTIYKEIYGKDINEYSKEIRELDNSSFSLQKKYDDIKNQREELRQKNLKLKQQRNDIISIIPNYSMFKKYNETSSIDKQIDKNHQKSLELYEEQKQLEKQLEEVKQQEKQKKIDEVNKRTTPFKDKQFKIIQKSNPMLDDYHTGIRQPGEIRTWAEAMYDAEQSGEGFSWGDFSKEDGEKALKNKSITIYSSYPIKNGVFVTPSRVQAEEYAGGEGNRVYSKTVRPDKVAWINVDEGQYADAGINTYEAKYSKDTKGWTDYVSNTFTKDNTGRELSKQQQEYFKDSKAVDDKGELEVVYHGSRKAGFTTFETPDNVSFFTDNEGVANTYSGSNEKVDTRKLESLFDAKTWLKGINEDLYIENNKVYDYDGEEILSFDNQEDLLKNLKRAIQIELGNTEAGGVYEGYVNITKPYTIDVEGQNWNNITIGENKEIKNMYDSLSEKEKDSLSTLADKMDSMYDNYKDSVEGFYQRLNATNEKLYDKVTNNNSIREKLYKAALYQWEDSSVEDLIGKRYSTNDIVKQVLEKNKNGSNYDGVIFKNIIDEGMYEGETDGSPSTVYVTLNPNQFKAVDNTNPTNDPDIRYSKDNKTWREYLEKEFPSQGTRTNLQDINERNKKLTEKEKTELDGLKALYETGLMEKTDEDYKRMQELERRNNIKETTKALNLEKEAPKKYSINENAKDDYVSMKVDKAIQKNAYKNLNVTTKAAENYLKFNREQKTNFKDSLLKFVGKTKEQLSNSKTHNQIKDLVNNYANVEYNYIDEELKSIKSEIRKTKINIPEELRKQITDYSDFRKQSKLNITKDGKDIDSIWQELSNDYPHIFDSSIQTEADMLYALSDLMNKDIKITEKYRIPDSDLDYAVTRIQNSLIDNALTQEELNNIEKDLQLKAERRTRQVVQQELLKKMDITLDDIESGKDIKALNYQITDPRRVNEKVFSPKVAQKINDATVNFVSEQEAKSNRWKNKERKEIKDLGIKARSKESAAVQKYGEKEWINDKGELLKYGDEQLAKEFPDIRTQEKIKNAAKVLREKYDNYIDMINTSIGEMGYDPIPKRKDYFRHFYEITDKFSQLGIPFNANDMSSDLLPTDINGLTDEFKPGKQWFASAQQRTGKKTVYDAITGIDGYLEGASNQIFHTESIQRYRTLSKLIRETYGQKALEDLNNLENLTEEARQKRIKEVYDNKLSGYAAWLDEQANAMAGKKGKIDRGVEEVAGRKIYSALNTLKKQVGSNMTGFNVRSAMTNFASAIQGASKVKKTAFLKGTLSTLQNIVHKDGLIEKSNFLTNRFGSDSLSNKMWQKVSNAGQIFMKGTDYFTANQIWRSKYFENMSKGMAEKQAIKNADDFASRIMGDRSKGQTASMFNSKTLGFLTQFQLEVNNQWQSMIHDNKMDIKTGNKSGATVLFQLGQLAAMSNLFNLMMKSLTGSDVMFDPIDILKGAINPDDDDKDKDLSERIREALGKIVDQLPMANVIKGTLFGNEGGRIPISEAFEGIKTTLGFAFHGKNKYNQDITWNDAKKDLLESLPYWIMPTGWGQLRKTIKGTEMYTGDKPVAGSYTDSGNLRFTADTSLAGKTKAALFGAYSSKEAQDYIKGGFKTITKGNNLDELKNLGYTSSQYKKYRQELNAAGRKNQEKIDYIMGLDIPKKEKDVMASRVLRKDVDTNDIKNFDTLTEFNKWYKKQYGSQKK